MSDEFWAVERAFKSHESEAPTWDDDPVGRDAAVRWHLRGFRDGCEFRSPAASLAEHDARVLEAAADRWSEWTTVVMRDGHRSVVQHGLDPDDWLRAEAARLREGSTEQ